LPVPKIRRLSAALSTNDFFTGGSILFAEPFSNAAALLGVSQPYLSLLEKGARPLTAALRSRMTVRQADRPESSDDRFGAQLSALGYPGFAHVAPAHHLVMLNIAFQVLFDGGQR
jgi:hypothetical protein